MARQQSGSLRLEAEGARGGCLAPAAESAAGERRGSVMEGHRQEAEGGRRFVQGANQDRGTAAGRRKRYRGLGRQAGLRSRCLCP